MQETKCTVVIPARGGSKGLKDKNILDFDGYPLVVYVANKYKSVLGSSALVVVSTDDSRIADLCKLHGIRVDMRPIHLGMDLTTTEQVISDILPRINTEIICLVQCTTPLIRDSIIKEAFIKFRGNPTGSLFSAYKSKIPVWSRYGQSMKILSDGDEFLSCEVRKPRQLLEGFYFENGGFYFFTKSDFNRSKNRFNFPLDVVECNKWESIDIDSLDDFIMARAYLEWQAR